MLTAILRMLNHLEYTFRSAAPWRWGSIWLFPTFPFWGVLLLTLVAAGVWVHELAGMFGVGACAVVLLGLIYWRYGD
jgi:hypothetical protein